MASKVEPWLSNTWWGKRHFKINVSLVIVLLLFLFGGGCQEFRVWGIA